MPKVLLLSRSLICLPLCVAAFFACTHLQTEKAAPVFRKPSNGSERGGGDALFCHSGLFGKKYYLADTFDIFSSSKKNVFKLMEAQIPHEHKRDFVFELLSIGIASDRQEFLKQIRSTINKFEIVPQEEIEDVDDDNIVLPEGCTKKVQLAVHDIGTYKIRVKESIYQGLTQTEKEFLLIHEVFIHAYYTLGYNIFDPEMKPADPSLPKKFDTSKIRSFLAKLVAGPQFDHWMTAFKSYLSTPGLRLHDLLVKIKFADFSTEKNTKNFYTDDSKELIEFVNLIKFEIVTAVKIWEVVEKEKRNFEDGWAQTFAAILNNEKGQNLGVVEFTCRRHLNSNDFNFKSQRVTGSLAGSPPVKIGHCLFNLLL